jgi:hypothetical protein
MAQFGKHERGAEMKPTLCKVCGTGYQKFQTTQKVCGPVCALTLSKDTLAKKRAKQTRKMRADMKATDRNHQLRLAQTAFNAFIRERDKDLPCISCGRHHAGQSHAGHYKTTAAHPELRFSEIQVWKQCAPCNNHLSGNIIEYRKGLLERIGQEKLDWIEGAHPPAKLTIVEIIAIKEKYRNLLKLLQNPESC